MNKYFICRENPYNTWCVRFSKSIKQLSKSNKVCIKDLYILKVPPFKSISKDRSCWGNDTLIANINFINDVKEEEIYELNSDEEALLMYEVL